MTTSAGPWWPPLDRGDGLVDLDPTECRRLLGTAHVGRLAYVCGAGPRIVPMNFVIAGDHLVFRTSPHSEAARSSLGRAVAFEVDQVDELTRTGGSVLVVGEAAELSLAMLNSLDVDRTPDPWPDGVRSLFLHLPLTELSGRRVRRQWR